MAVMKDLNTPELYLTPASQIQMYADCGQKKFSNHHLNTGYWYNIAEKYYLARTNNQIEKHVSFKTPIETTLSFQQPCFEDEYEKPCDAEPNKRVMNEYLTVEQNQNGPFDLIKMKVQIDSKELNGKFNISSNSNIMPLKSNLKGKNEIGPLNVCDKSVSDLDDFIMYASMSLPDIPKDIYLDISGEIHSEDKTNSAKENKDTYNNIGDLSEYKSPALHLGNVDLQQMFEATDDTYQSLNTNQIILTNVYQPSKHPAPCSVSMDLEDHESNHSINGKYVTIQDSSNQIEKESNIVIDIDNCYEDVYDAIYDKMNVASSSGFEKGTSISDLHSAASDSFILSSNHETAHNVKTRNVYIIPEQYEPTQSMNDNNPNNVIVQVTSNQFDSQRSNLVYKDSNTVIDIDNCYDDVYDTAYDKTVPHSSNGFRKTPSFSVPNFDASDHFISAVDSEVARNAATQNVSIDLEDHEPSHSRIDNSRDNVSIQVSLNGFESQQNDLINNESNVVADIDKCYDDVYDAAYDKIVPVLSTGFRKDTNISDCNSTESDSFTSSVDYESKTNYDGDVQENNSTIVENILAFESNHDYQNYPCSYSACESDTETSSVIKTDNDSIGFQSDKRENINHREYENYPANSHYIEEEANKVGLKKFRSNSTNLDLKSAENKNESITDEGNLTTSKEVSILSNLDSSDEGRTSHTQIFLKDFRNEFQNDSSNEDEMKFMNEYETTSISDDETNVTNKSDDEFVNDSLAESLASYTNDILMINQSESIYNMDTNINTKALQTSGKEDEKLESVHQFCDETNISDGSRYILVDQRNLLPELIAEGNDNQYFWEVYKSDQFDAKKHSRLNAVTSYSEWLKEVNDNNKETSLQEKDAAIKNKQKEDIKDIYVVNQKSLQDDLKSNVIFKGAEHIKKTFTVNPGNFEQNSNNDIDKNKQKYAVDTSTLTEGASAKGKGINSEDKERKFERQNETENRNIDTESERDSEFYSCDNIFEHDEYENQTEDKTQWRKLTSSIAPANYEENNKDDLDLSGFDDKLCLYVYTDGADSNFANSHKIEQNQLTGRLSANTDYCSSKNSANVDEPVTTYNVEMHFGQQMRKPVVNTKNLTENRIKDDKLIIDGNACDLEKLENISYCTQVDKNRVTDKSSSKCNVVVNVKRDIQEVEENDYSDRIYHSTTTFGSYKNSDNVVFITNPRDNNPVDKTTLNNRFCTSDLEKMQPSDVFLQKQNNVSISEPNNVSNLTEHFIFDEAPLVNTHSHIPRYNESDKSNGVISLENNSDFLKKIHLTQIMVNSKWKALQELYSVNLADTECGYKMGEKVKSHNTVNASYVAENLHLFLGRQKSVLDGIHNQHPIHDLNRNLNSTVFITDKNESLQEKIDRWYNYNSQGFLTDVNQESDTGNIKNNGDQCRRKSSSHVIETQYNSVYIEKDSCIPSSAESLEEPHKALSTENSSLKSFEREVCILSSRTGLPQNSFSYKSSLLLDLQEDEHFSPLPQNESSSVLQQRNPPIISDSSPSAALETYEEDLDLNIACDLSSQYSEISSGDIHKSRSKINIAAQSMMKDNANENFVDDTGLLLTTATTNKTNLHEKPLSGESSCNEIDKTTSNSSSEKTIVDDSKNNQTLFEKVKQVKRLLWLVNLSNKNKESPNSVNKRKKLSRKSKLSLAKISDRGSLAPKNNVHQTLTVANAVDLLLLQQNNGEDRKSQQLDSLNENESKLVVSAGSRMSLTTQEKHDPQVVAFDRNLSLNPGKEGDNKYNEQDLSKLVIQNNNHDSTESINLISFESDTSKELFNDSFQSFRNSTDDFRKSLSFSVMLDPTNQFQSATNIVQPLISNAFTKKLAALYINKTKGKQRETLSKSWTTSESSLSLTFDSQSSVEPKTNKFQDTLKVTNNTNMSKLVLDAEGNSALFEDLTIDTAEKLPHDLKHTEIDYPTPNCGNLSGSKILQENMNMPMVKETHEGSDVLGNDSTEIDKISQRKGKEISISQNKTYKRTDLSTCCKSNSEGAGNEVYQRKCFQTDAKSETENQSYQELFEDNGHQNNENYRSEAMIDERYKPGYERIISKKSQVQLVLKDSIFTQIKGKYQMTQNLEGSMSPTESINSFGESGNNQPFDYKDYIPCNVTLHSTNLSQSTTNLVQPLVSNAFSKRLLSLYSNIGMTSNTGSTNSNTKDTNSDLVVTTNESVNSFRSVVSTVQNMTEMDSKSVKNQSDLEQHSEEIQVDSLDKNSCNLDVEVKGSTPFTKSSVVTSERISNDSSFTSNIPASSVHQLVQNPMEKLVSSSLSSSCREIMTMDRTIGMLSNTRKSSDILSKTTSSLDNEISLTGSVAFTDSQKSICSTRSDGHHKMLEYNSKDENLERLHRDYKKRENGRTEKVQQIPLNVTSDAYIKKQILQEKYGVKTPRQCIHNRLIKDCVLSQIKENFKLHNEIGIKFSATDRGVGEYGGQKYDTPVRKAIDRVKENTTENRLREVASDSLIIKNSFTMSHSLNVEKSNISLNSYTCSVRLFDIDHLVAEFNIEEEEVNKAKRIALAQISKRYSSLIIANAKAVVYKENLRKRSINNECNETLTKLDILKRSDSKHIQEVSRKTILPPNELLMLTMKQIYDSESYQQGNNKDQKIVNYPVDDFLKKDNIKVNTEVDTSNEFNSVDSRTNHEHHMTKRLNEVVKNSNVSASNEKMTRNLEKMKTGSANETCSKINSATICTKQGKHSVLMEKKLDYNIQKTLSNSGSLNTNLGEVENKIQNVTKREGQIEGPVEDSVFHDIQSNGPDKQEIKVHDNPGIRLHWKYPSKMEESNISHVTPLNGNKTLAHLTVDHNVVKSDRVIEFEDTLSRRIIANTKVVMRDRNSHVSVDKSFNKLRVESQQNRNSMEVDGDTSRQTSNQVEVKIKSEGAKMFSTKDSNKDGMSDNNICIQKDVSIPLLPDLYPTINFEDKDYESKLDKTITNGNGTQQDLKMSLLNQLKDTYETNKTEHFVKESDNEIGNKKCESLKQKYGAIIPKDRSVEEIIKDLVLTQIQDKFIEKSRIMNVKDSKNDMEEAAVLNCNKQSTSAIVKVRLIENEEVICYCKVNEGSNKNVDIGKITLNIISQFVESIIQNCKRKLELAQQKKVIRKRSKISEQKPRWRYLYGEEIPPNSMVTRLIKDCVMVQIKEKYGTLDIDSQGSFSDTEITSKKKIQLRGKYNDVVLTNSEVLGHCIEYDQSGNQFYDSDKNVIHIQGKLTGNANGYLEKSIFEKIDCQENVSNTEAVDKEKLESMNMRKTVILHPQNPAETFIQNSFLTQMKENFFAQKSGKAQLNLDNKDEPIPLTNIHEKRLLKDSLFTQTKDVPLSIFSNVNPNHKRNFGKLYSQDVLNQKPSPLNANDVQDTQRRTSYRQEQVGKSTDNGKNLEKCIQSLYESKINKHSSTSCKGSSTNSYALKGEFNNVSTCKNSSLSVNSRRGVFDSVSSTDTVILNLNRNVKDVTNKLSSQYSIIQVDSHLMKRNCAPESQNIEATQGHVDITTEKKDENERGQNHVTNEVTFAEMAVNAATNEFPRRDLRTEERPKEQFQGIQCNDAYSKTADVNSYENISPSVNLNNVTNNENLSILLNQGTDTLSPENLKEVKVKDANPRNLPLFSSEILYQNSSTSTKNPRNSTDFSSTSCSNETKEEVLVKIRTSKARIWKSDSSISQKSIVLNITQSGASVKRKLCDTAGTETCIENESLAWPFNKRVKQLPDEQICSDGKYIREKATTSKPTKLVISNTVLRRSSVSPVSSVNEVDGLTCESVLSNDSSFDFHLDRLFGSTSLLFMRSSSQLFLQQIKKKTSNHDWLALIGQNYFRNESGSKLFTSSSNSSSSTSCYKTHDNSSCSSCDSKYSIKKESHSNVKLDILRYIAPSPSITSMQNNSDSVVRKEDETDVDSKLYRKSRKGKKMNERMEKLWQLNKQITVSDRENESSSKKKRLNLVSVFAKAVNKFGGRSKTGRCQEHLEKESSKSAEYLDDIIKKKMKRASKNYFRKTPSNERTKLYQSTSKSSKNNYPDIATKEVMQKEINEKSGKPSETKPKLVRTLWSKWKQKHYETSSQSGDFRYVESNKQTPNSATVSENISFSGGTTGENNDSGNVAGSTNENPTTKTIDCNKVYSDGKKKDYIKPVPDLISIGNQSNERSSYIIHNIPFRRGSLSHGSLTLNQEQENINQQFAKARKVFQPKRFDISELLPMKKYSSSGSHEENKTALIKIKYRTTREKSIEAYETQNEDRANSSVEKNQEHRFQNISPTSDEIIISNIRSIKSESSLEAFKIAGPSFSSRIRMFQKQ